MKCWLASAWLLCLTGLSVLAQPTVAHQWSEQVLEAIRNDFARPTVHARNLYHSSILMYDCWTAYDTTQSSAVFLGKNYDGFFCPKFGNCLDAKCLRRVAALVALGLIAGNGNFWWTFERGE